MRFLYLILGYSFLEPYWTGCQYGETNPYPQPLIYLIYVIYLFDLYTPCILLCTWLCLFGYQ